MGYSIMDRLLDLIDDQAEWSQRTFGTDKERGPVAALKHLKKEADEAILAFQVRRSMADSVVPASDESRKMADAKAIEELADCFLLMLDATRRGGFDFGDLVVAARDKMQMNRTRIWPRPESPEDPVEHIRDEQG